jgi:hypothetical protein
LFDFSYLFSFFFFSSFFLLFVPFLVLFFNQKLKLQAKTPASNRILVENLGMSPGNQEQNESLRSESTGYLSVLRFIYHYQNFHEVSFENCNKRHFCDNSSLVSRFPSTYQSAPTSPFEYLKADYDVQMQIIQTLKDIGTDIPTIHVHGHQDDIKSNSLLSYQVKLNIRADTLATQAYQKYPQNKQHVH